MTTWAVLATGPSMSKAIAGAVHGRCRVVAVSDAYRLAPWADVLVSADCAWWNEHPDALKFAGRKFSAYGGSNRGIEPFKAPSGANSGLLGLMVAVHLGATKILLCGVDLHSPGNHFFGRHPDNLKSTTADRLETFKAQFHRYRPKGVDIVNCSPGSALKAYPMGRLEDHLC